MRRRSLGVSLIVAALAIGLSAPPMATEAQVANPQAEREKVRAERAQVAAQIDTSKASLSEIDDALEAIEENLRTQEAALARTEAEVAQAEQDIADAEAAIERLGAEITVLREEMRKRAIAAYVNPPGDDVLSVLQTNDFTTAANRKFYIELRSQGDADVSDRLKGATVDMEHERVKASEAREVAEAKRSEQAERTEAVASAREQQQTLSDSVQASIDDQIERSLDLAETDRELSAQIAREAAERALRIAAERAARDAAIRDAEARQAARRAQSNQRDDGSETGPIVASGESFASAGVDVCPIPGFSSGVNCKIQDRVIAMVNAAAADGVTLRGGGWRSSASQISLRKQHCGTSSYAIYQMSSGSCRPPTAKPGSSQHEIGLAIDFSNCSSRSTACFGWLKGNASRFGFYNLPSEAWHWSTSGS